MSHPAELRVLLVDNGSLEPRSTLQLRETAAALQQGTGVRVDPTSLAHSAKIAAERLNGTPAELFETAVDRALHEGVKNLVVVPLFIGPSHAVVRVLPAILAERHTSFPALTFVVTPPLYAAGDRRLARILAEHVTQAAAEFRHPRVAIVDHGSPNRVVTEVRDAIATEVRELLANSVVEVVACSMERREGAEYDFNEPLLATVLGRAEWKQGPKIVGMLFIGPGRHAGPDGDVAQICRDSGAAESELRMSKLLAQHPLLLDILSDRIAGGVSELLKTQTP